MSFGTVLRACFVTTFALHHEAKRSAVASALALGRQGGRARGGADRALPEVTSWPIRGLKILVRFVRLAAVFKSRISHVIALYQVSSQNQGPSAMSIEAVIFPSRSCGTREMSEISRDMFRRKK